MTLHYASSSATHPGNVRTRNEDAIIERSDIGLWAVADGAGGHGAGDVASSAVVQALAELPQGLSAAELLAQVRLRISAVHERLRASKDEQGSPLGMASTVVIAMARGDHFACLWAGDSRAYLFRRGVLGRLTRDHSLVQGMVDAGLLEQDEARHHPQSNVITRAVGGATELELDKVAGHLVAGDKVMLCSDGLHGLLSEEDLRESLARGAGPEDFIALALTRSARDNVSVLIVTVDEDVGTRAGEATVIR
jgi:serine/threonine protein phosphatase Stp1